MEKLEIDRLKQRWLLADLSFINYHHLSVNFLRSFLVHFDHLSNKDVELCLLSNSNHSCSNGLLPAPPEAPRPASALETSVFAACSSIWTLERLPQTSFLIDHRESEPVPGAVNEQQQQQ